MSAWKPSALVTGTTIAFSSACLTYVSRRSWAEFGPEVVVFVLTLGMAVFVYPIAARWLDEARLTQGERDRMADHMQAAQTLWSIASASLIEDQRRTKIHLNCLFGLILLMILLAFALIVGGCWLLLTSSTQVETGKISAISGTVVAFMGGSAFVVYNRLMDQSNMHSRMLERLNIAAYARDLIGGIKDADVQSAAKEKLALELVKNSRETLGSKRKKLVGAEHSIASNSETGGLAD